MKRTDEEENNKQQENEKQDHNDKNLDEDRPKSDNENKDNENLNNEKENDESKPDKKTIKPITLAGVVRYLSRIDNISLSYDDNLGSTFRSHQKRPELLYQIGLPDILSDDVLDSRNTKEKYTASTNFDIIDRLSTSWNFSKEFSRRFGSVSKLTVTTIFPSVTVTLNQFETLIKAEQILTSSHLSSGFTLTTTEDGDLDWVKNKTPENEQASYSFSPLISWTGNWIHDVSSNLAFNYTRASTTNHQIGTDIVRTNTNWNINSNISWSFRAPKGMKLPLLGRFKFKNELTTSIGFTFENILNETENAAAQNPYYIEANKKSFSITPSASYKFSNNIDGGLTSSYSWSYDKKTDLKIKIFNLSFWVEIQF